MAYPLLENIRSQPEALGKVRKYHLGEGLPELLKTAELLRDAAPIVITGMGASYYACLPFVQSLRAYGNALTLWEAAELLEHGINALSPGSLVVWVSRSGEGNEISGCLPLIKEHKAKLLAITNSAQSRLAQEADAVYLIGSPPDGQRVAIQTYTATLAALYMLAEAVANRLASPSLRALDEAIEASAKIIPVLEADSQNWPSFFEGSGSLYLLGGGPSLAAALEGALLFAEVAKQPSVAMSAGQFRHGVVEVIDPFFRGIVFTPDDSARQRNLALARDIIRLGGQARVIGPDSVPSEDQLETWSIPQTSAGLSSLVEIIPIQLAAYRLAECRGLSPGEFRHPRI